LIDVILRLQTGFSNRLLAAPETGFGPEMIYRLGTLLLKPGMKRRDFHNMSAMPATCLTDRLAGRSIWLAHFAIKLLESLHDQHREESVDGFAQGSCAVRIMK